MSYVKTHYIRLNMNRQSDIDVINLISQDVYTNKLHIALLDEGTTINLTGVQSVTITFKKPDSNIVVETATIYSESTGEIQCFVNEQVLALEGTVDVQVQLNYGGGNIVSSNEFPIAVVEDPYDGSEESIESASSFPILEELLEVVNNLNIEPYTQTQLDNGVLDGRYYTKVELNNGQLDSQYYTESEIDEIISLLDGIVVKGVLEVDSNSDVLSDFASQYIKCTNESDITFTIQPEITVNFPIGSEITFIRYNDGEVKFEPEDGVTLDSFYNKRKISNKYNVVKLRKMGSDEWLLSGQLSFLELLFGVTSRESTNDEVYYKFDEPVGSYNEISCVKASNDYVYGLTFDGTNGILMPFNLDSDIISIAEGITPTTLIDIDSYNQFTSESLKMCNGKILALTKKSYDLKLRSFELDVDGTLIEIDSITNSNLDFDTEFYNIKLINISPTVVGCLIPTTTPHYYFYAFSIDSSGNITQEIETLIEGEISVGGVSALTATTFLNVHNSSDDSEMIAQTFSCDFVDETSTIENVYSLPVDTSIYDGSKTEVKMVSEDKGVMFFKNIDSSKTAMIIFERIGTSLNYGELIEFVDGYYSFVFAKENEEIFKIGYNASEEDTKLEVLKLDGLNNYISRYDGIMSNYPITNLGLISLSDDLYLLSGKTALNGEFYLNTIKKGIDTFVDDLTYYEPVNITFGITYKLSPTGGLSGSSGDLKSPSVAKIQNDLYYFAFVDTRTEEIVLLPFEVVLPEEELTMLMAQPTFIQNVTDESQLRFNSLQYVNGHLVLFREIDMETCIVTTYSIGVDASLTEVDSMTITDANYLMPDSYFTKNDDDTVSIFLVTQGEEMSTEHKKLYIGSDGTISEVFSIVVGGDLVINSSTQINNDDYIAVCLDGSGMPPTFHLKIISYDGLGGTYTIKDSAPINLDLYDLDSINSCQMISDSVGVLTGEYLPTSEEKMSFFEINNDTITIGGITTMVDNYVGMYYPLEFPKFIRLSYKTNNEENSKLQVLSYNGVDSFSENYSVIYSDHPLHPATFIPIDGTYSLISTAISIMHDPYVHLMKRGIETIVEDIPMGGGPV